MLITAGCVLFLGLARWQWDRAHSISGDWQNLGYALQWPLFAIFLAAAWARFLWLEQHRDPPVATRAPAAAPASRSAGTRGAGTRSAGTRADPTRSNPEDDPDDELAAYNAYLARLADEDQRR